jgi:hypothetical protein
VTHDRLLRVLKTQVGCAAGVHRGGVRGGARGVAGVHGRGAVRVGACGLDPMHVRVSSASVGRSSAKGKQCAAGRDGSKTALARSESAFGRGKCGDLGP